MVAESCRLRFYTISKQGDESWCRRTEKLSSKAKRMGTSAEE